MRVCLFTLGLMLSGLFYGGGVFAQANLTLAGDKATVSCVKSPSKQKSDLPVQQKIEEKEKLKVRFIGASFKFLAKTYTAVINLEKVKARNIAVITKMPADKFHKHYAECYCLLKDLPPEYISEYKVTPNMSKDQVIASIRLLDKKRVYQIISVLPNKTIMESFRASLRGQKEGAENDKGGCSLVGQVKNAWKDVIARVKG